MIEFRTRLTPDRIKNYNSIIVVVDENLIKIVGRTIFVNEDEELETIDKVLHTFDVAKKKMKYKEMGINE